MFILGRAIAGAGAADIYQGEFCIVGLTVPLEKRAIYLGIVPNLFIFATCSGPIVRKAFTSNASWRWYFEFKFFVSCLNQSTDISFRNLPFGVFNILLTIIFLQFEDLKNEDKQLPLMAKLLLVAAISCLLLALQWHEPTYPWRSSIVIGLFVGVRSLIAAFYLLQLYLGENSTIPPRIFQQQSVFMGSFYIFFLNIANYIVSQLHLFFTQEFYLLKVANMCVYSRTDSIYCFDSKRFRVHQLQSESTTPFFYIRILSFERC